MTIKEGDRLPEATVRHMTDDGPKAVTTTEFFQGKKVALFSVPGAFTPTCSAQHLPGFVEHADVIKSKGIDVIACIAVNNAFVMDAWGKDRGVGDKIVMLADGNGDLTNKLGLELDGSGFGLGSRGQRFSMIVDDCTVINLNIEAPGAFEVSKAEVIIDQLN